MNEISREILDKYQVRKTSSQKTAFIAFMKEKYPRLHVEEGGFPRCRNLVVGDPARAKMVFCAHYDTCAVMPFPNLITPKNILFYLIYSILVCLPFLALGAAATGLMSYVTDSYAILYWTFLIVYFAAFFGMMLLGPANKHTVNDNTSGVITLCELLEKLPESVQEQICFVFFDHEESGLWGSKQFFKTHKATMKNIPVINFDCVSDGDHILLVQSKPFLKKYGEALKAAFADEDGLQIHFAKSSTTLYPSDQGNFPVSVGVAAMKRGWMGLYLDRIHTPRDTVMKKENIRYLVESAARFAKECGIQ